MIHNGIVKTYTQYNRRNKASHVEVSSTTIEMTLLAVMLIMEQSRVGHRHMLETYRPKLSYDINVSGGHG